MTLARCVAVVSCAISLAAAVPAASLAAEETGWTPVFNGKQVGECRDKTFAKGKIGLQVHGGNDFKGMKIVLKKLEIRPLKPGDKPRGPAAE